MDIFFFTEVSPFPINGGEQIRSYGLLKALSKLGYNITACIQNRNKIDLDRYKMKNIKFIEYSNSTKNWFDLISSKHYFLKESHVIEIFSDVLSKEKPNVVILDYFLVGRYISFFTRRKIPVIVGTHNAQSELHRQVPVRNMVQGIRKLQNFLFMLMHERLYYRFADGFMTVSDEDRKFYEKMVEKSKIHVIPNFLDEDRYSKVYQRENYFVLPANFNAYMNFEGLKWFMNEVWNKDLDASYKLILVGKNSLESFKKLNKSKQFYNIVAVGEVDDITDYIAKAKAVIIPLLHGSGSRLKCLEAMVLKTPIISTTKGVESIKSENILIANTPLEFRNKIRLFSYNKEDGEKLYQDFINEYSLYPNTIRIQKMIEQTLQNYE